MGEFTTRILPEAEPENIFNYEQAMLGKPDEPAIDPIGFYNIDFDKITRAEDIVAILAAVNFSFVGNHPRVHLIAHLLDRANVQYPKENQYGQPIEDAPKEIKLPKVTKVNAPKPKLKNENGESGL
jgi:hypothetical protein